MDEFFHSAPTCIRLQWLWLRRQLLRGQVQARPCLLSAIVERKISYKCTVGISREKREIAIKITPQLLDCSLLLPAKCATAKTELKVSIILTFVLARLSFLQIKWGEEKTYRPLEMK